MKLFSIDIFSGMGGLTEGMHQAGFITKVAIENDECAVQTYKLNHYNTEVISKDIRLVSSNNIKKILDGEILHLLAGCPPCQGFSSLRRLNRNRNVRDDRNSLILEFLRLVNDLKPITIMMENVPGLVNYYLFKKLVRELDKLEYNPKYEIVDISDYGVPQRRKRLILVGSKLGNLELSNPKVDKKHVLDTIGNLESVESTEDPLHKIYSKHSERILERIKNIPKDGGSLKDADKKFQYKCHEKANIGFYDVFGRMPWNDLAPTITGGCLNPSKGRFLHPEEDRCITAREAALLQSFPKDYKIPTDIPKDKISLLIGNALPPKFSYFHSNNIKNHLNKYLA